MEFGAVYDISPRLGDQDAVYPGDPPCRVTPFSHLERGDSFQASLLELGAHAGAHLDAPAHFLAGGRTIDDYPPERFILPARLVEARGRRAVGADALYGLDLPPGGAVLFKTDNSAGGLATSGRYDPAYAHLTPEAARAALAVGVSLVGVDYLSVDGPDDPAFPVHRLLLEAGALILEGLDLSQPQPGDYTLICLPLKLKGAEASPVRAVLLA